RSIPKRELVGAMAWMTMPALIGPLVGPLVGGFITTYFDWRWIFWINIPMAVLGLVMATIFVPDIRAETRRRFDAVGFALIGLGIFAFVTGSTALGVGILETTHVAIVIALGAGLLVTYALYSHRRTSPIIDLSLFRIPSLRVGLIGGAFARLGVGGTPFLLPLMLQYGFGMTPFESGAVTFVGAAGAIGLKTVSTRLIRRFGFRTVVVVNSAITAIVVAIPGLFHPGVALPLIYAILLFAGFFRALQLTTTQILGFVDVPSHRMSQATTLSSVFQQTSMSLGISAAALVLQLQVGPGGEIGADDFFWPFVTLGCLSLLSAPFFWSLRADVGQEVSGHQPRVVAPAE
ncbi:MAG: MFS transporter, partial [Bauldia sp.]|nr:MFS transporter [Bauldia sp.]